jgi:hypothetical protein
MSSGKSPIRSRSKCPECGNPLYYVRTAFTFLSGLRKRLCLAPNCKFVDSRRFRITSHHYAPRTDQPHAGQLQD